MFIIKGKESYYTIKEIEKNIEKKEIYKIPIIKKQGILTFAQWKYKYNNIIENIFIKFINSLLNIDSDKFICHIDIENIKLEFIQKMYEKSHNSSKYYP